LPEAVVSDPLVVEPSKVEVTSITTIELSFQDFPEAQRSG
jgi:hypothetical protein